jgi:hypothetical protein
MASRMFLCVQEYLLISVLVEISLLMDFGFWIGSAVEIGSCQEPNCPRAIANLKFLGHNGQLGTGIKVNGIQPYPVILLSVRKVKFIGKFCDQLSLNFAQLKSCALPTDKGFKVLGLC